ncbi:MAG: hypothetical protein LUB61_00695 [Eggerthellaceae bacterium]|nr:hypothetical protein [Eggerthellaceae bacterium]
MDKIQQLADYIDQSNNIVATTGAGISVGGGGITYGQMRHSGISGARSNDEMLRNFLDSLFNYDPSYSHHALERLEEEGRMLGVITTNVDCMHTLAGSKNVAEIQGSMQVNCCENCGRHYDSYEIWQQDELPICESCGGSILPWPIYSHIGIWNEDARKARDWISRADLILVIGTRGNYGDVYWGYRNKNAPIIQINPGHTGFDMIADLNIRQDCDDVFRAVEERRKTNA